jgi:hypothetical protein
MVARLARVRRLSADGRQAGPKIGLNLSEALAGIALLAFLLGVIRLFSLGDRLGFVATMLVGQAGCFAAAIVLGLRGDPERLRLSVLMGLGYVTILLLYSPFLSR